MTPRRPVPLRLLTAVAGAVVTTGALVSCGAGSVGADDLESRIAEELESSQGSAPDSVECPDDLPAEVGATTTCVATGPDGEFDTEIEVTAVEDNQVNFEISVPEGPS